MASYLPERQKVADMCRYLSDRAYFAGTGGNIGLRVAENLFAVTPSATDYAEVGAQEIVLLTLDKLEVVEGDKTPTVEKALHAAMLRAFPERRASVHTHQPVASAVALLHEKLPWPDGLDKAQLGLHIGLVPYRPSGTGMLAKAFAKAIRPEVYAYLMASHGAICAGADLEDASRLIRHVEAAAAAALKYKIAKNKSLDAGLRALVLGTLDAAHSKGMQ